MRTSNLGVNGARLLGCALVVLVATATMVPSTSHAQTPVLTTLHSFQDSVDGAGPTGLVRGSDGNFYGAVYTTYLTGAGTIFRITPAGVTTTLHAFNGSDGYGPTGILIDGGDGNFYGTTRYGGTNDLGTVFRVTPAGDLTVLHSFAVADGTRPLGSLLKGNDGNFYGTASGDGEYGAGTIFRVTPAGNFSVFYNFDGSDSQGPIGTLIQGSDGNFYGASGGGRNSSEGGGTVFQLTSSGVLTTLRDFPSNDGNGYGVGSYLLQATDGGLYGYTTDGGPSTNGLLFELRPPYIMPDGWTLSRLHIVPNADGVISCLFRSNDGTLYGTTSQGSDAGTIFRFMPDGTATVIYTFSGTNGDHPQSPLSDTGGGVFYGVTAGGGSESGGTVYRLELNPPTLPPAITSASVLGLANGAACHYEIIATNYPTSYAASGLPGGLSIDTTTGLISGSTTTPGTFAAKLTVTNAAGTGTSTLTVTVGFPPPTTPVIDVPSGPSASENFEGHYGQPYSYQIVAENYPTSYAADGLPTGLSVNTATGLISGTPTQYGSFNINLSATNAVGTGTASVGLYIDPLVPVITSVATATAQLGQPFDYLVTAAFSPTNLSADGLPAGLSVDTKTGRISGAPSQAGLFTVTLRAYNGTGEGTGTLLLTVAPPMASLVAMTPLVTANSGDVGEFILSLSAAQEVDVVVSFTIKGTAVNGTDYVLLKTTKKIKAGHTSKPIKIG